MNHVTLIGRLTQDPELKFNDTGLAIATMRLAVPRRKKDDGAVFINIVSFGKQAETVGKYLAKGRRIGVTGRLELNEWTADDGTKRSRHEIIADQIEFLDPATKSDEPESINTTTE